MKHSKTGSHFEAVTVNLNVEVLTLSLKGKGKVNVKCHTSWTDVSVYVLCLAHST